jgi:uncharacterized protein (TIGR02453 family)
MDFKKLISFLEQLALHNNKDWFDQNRGTYTDLRTDWIQFVQDLIASIQAIDPSIGSIDAKNCIFRINKDVRFSKDKSPYKTNFGAIINKGGKKEMTSGYYIHIDPKEIFVAGGSYQPSPELLASVRQELDYNFDEFKGIVEHKNAVKLFGALNGEKLSRPPKGYTDDNPAISYLKHKSFIFVKNISTKDLFAKGFEKEVIHAFMEMKPLNDFLNRCL